MACRIISFFLLLLSWSLFFHDISYSGEFRVSPIRLDLDAKAKSGVVTVFNESDVKLQCQMKAFEWTQDSEGKDVYNETQDIIFFPRLMTVDPKSERIIRAGIRIPAVAKEKTYRLFIEEIPEPKKTEGTAVAVTIRFGVPIFVRPVKEEAKGAIENVGLSKGTISIAVRNAGNVHLIINSVTILGKDQKGEKTFARELSGWYLLNGVSRTYSAPIPPDACVKTAAFDTEVKTDRLNLKYTLNVDASMCGQ
ncbi:MAG TPA: fimbria/pilus periplasmic chaperone [Syntrophorhabdaceae bacterium]|nr:fimbria/pilus periplasmic chaperone [Syntrophorhabdaceae bacterium]HQM80427.1 fimbria/pilus periplasmic chaperone [Syntrophorhabdaceae bacterium]